jgi:hypothetical protein
LAALTEESNNRTKKQEHRDREWVKSAEASLMGHDISSEIRTLVSDLHAAGKSFVSELQSASLSMQSAQKSLLRQASMPSLGIGRDSPPTSSLNFSGRELSGSSFHMDMNASAGVPPHTRSERVLPEAFSTQVPPASMSFLSPEVLAPPPRISHLSLPAPPWTSLQDYIATSPAIVPPEAHSFSGLYPQGAESGLQSFIEHGVGDPRLTAPSLGHPRHPSRFRGLGRQPAQPLQSSLQHSSVAVPSRAAPKRALAQIGLSDKLGALDAKLSDLDAKFRQLSNSH